MILLLSLLLLLLLLAALLLVVVVEAVERVELDPRVGGVFGVDSASQKTSKNKRAKKKDEKPTSKRVGS